MVSFAAVLSFIAVAATTNLLAVPGVDAHGYIIAPKAEGAKGASHPSVWIVEYPPPWEGSWKDPANFAKTSKEKGFSTLRSYLEDKGATCGNTNPDVSPRAIPADKIVRFSRDIPHAGPCELWIDDTRVYQNDDCESAFKGTIPTWTVDWSLCKGKCMLRFYWLGLQASGKLWQVYKNCVPVTGSGSGSSPVTTTTAPATTTKAPATTPKTTTKAPAATTKAPSKAAPTPTKAEVGGESGLPSGGAKNGTTSVKCKAKRS